MKFITTFVQRFVIREIPRPLGRWKVEHGIAMNHKIDLSNEDHCGPCGQYALSCKKPITNKKKDIN